MTTAPAETQDTERVPVRSLTRGQITVLTIATLPMIGVGAAGAIGTYANASSVLHRGQTAIGVVAAGEGATLVAALVMIGVTMLGQTAPATIRAALWLLPTAASVMGLTIAPTMQEAVVYALTPLAMTAAAEGISFLARRIVVHRTGIDMEAQRRNAATMQRMAVLRALATSHPNEKARKRAELASWRLAKKVGAGDAALGAYLVTVQRDRMTTGADIALASMFVSSGQSELPAVTVQQEADGPVDRTEDAVDQKAADRPGRTDRTATVDHQAGPDRTEQATATVDRAEPAVDRPQRTAGPDRQQATVQTDRPAQQPATTVDRTGPDQADRAPTGGPDRTADAGLVLTDLEQEAVDRLRSTNRSISKRSIADVVRNELGRSISSDRTAEIARHFRTLRSAA